MDWVSLGNLLFDCSHPIASTPTVLVARWREPSEAIHQSAGFHCGAKCEKPEPIPYRVKPDTFIPENLQMTCTTFGRHSWLRNCFSMNNKTGWKFYVAKRRRNRKYGNSVSKFQLRKLLTLCSLTCTSTPTLLPAKFHLHGAICHPYWAEKKQKYSIVNANELSDHNFIQTQSFLVAIKQNTKTSVVTIGLLLQTIVLL